MLEQNAKILLQQIAPTDLVLEIGAWACPFNRADWVFDLMPYETRGAFGHAGPSEECFTKATWLQGDVCSRAGLPFSDRQFDYVICSHVLEDIRDPLFACSEMIRVGRAGYLEVPSRMQESVMGLERPGYAGYCHHRWLVEVEDNTVTFRMKSHLLHGKWEYHFPRAWCNKLAPEEKVAWLFWDDSFECREAIHLSRRGISDELAQFARRRRAYPEWRYRVSRSLARLSAGGSALAGRFPVVARLLRFSRRFLGSGTQCEGSRPAWSDVPEIFLK